MKWFKAALDFFLYSNIFIGICAAGLTASSFVLTGHSLLDNISFLIFSFSVTLVSYSFHALVKPVKETNDSRLSFINKHTILLRWITFLGIIVSVCLVLSFSFVQWILCVHLAVLSFFYSSGIKLRGRSFVLSHVPYLKVFLIAYAWMVLTVVLPLWSQVAESDLFVLGPERFLLILALAIPFDIRDLNSDLAQKLETFPSLLGSRNSGLLTVFIIFLAIFYRYMLSGAGFHLFATTGVLILVIIVLPAIIRKRTPYLYSLGVDGMMLVYFLFVFGFRS